MFWCGPQLEEILHGPVGIASRAGPPPGSAGRRWPRRTGPGTWPAARAVADHLPGAGGCRGPRGRPGPASPQKTSAAASTSAPGTAAGAANELPEGYLTDAIDLIRENAFYAGRVDWPAVRAEARRAGASPSRARTYDTIRWVLSRLGDHHSFLRTPEQATALASGGGWSFGLTALFPERVVVDVEPGGAAAGAGVQVGDLVGSVDGRPVQGTRSSGCRPATGGRPARVRLALRRGEGDRARQLQAVVEAAQAPMVRPPTARRLSSRVSLLELFGFASPAERDAVRYVDTAHDAIRQVASRRTWGWVVDLRRDTGGSLPPMLTAVGPVLGDGRAVGYRGRDGATNWNGYRDGAVLFDGRPGSPAASRPARLPHSRPPVAVLTSRLTASAGEGVTMAFRGRPAARSFGEPTAGVPTGNGQYLLPDGAGLYLTAGIGVDRDGRTYETRIRPDQPVVTDWTRYGTPADPVLEAATAWLGARCAGP
jgi:carboxyl-terminal processing protease